METKLPKDPECWTREMYIDKFSLPEYLGTRPPLSMPAIRKVREIFIQQAKDAHAKVALRVESWRHNVTSRGHLDWDWGSSYDEQGFHVLKHEPQQRFRHARDMENLTDFVNGKVKGVHKPRLICWPVLITAKLFAVWYQPRDREQVLDLRWTESLTRLDPLGI